MTTEVFINEFHYDNSGSDTGEFIEIAGSAGTDLTGWSLVLYNGSNNSVYNTQTLSSTIPDLGSGFGTVVVNYPTDGIQNGSPDGIALVDNNGSVVQFLSYEGSFTAIDGAAAGLTSIDIGVSESSSTPVGFSLQLTGTGTMFEDFIWSTPSDDSPGAVNNGQTFASGGGPATNVLINEIDADQTSTDSAEFIELYDGGAGNTSLNGLVVVLYNGSSNTVYDAIDLDGQSTDADGYFVIGSANVPNVDLVEFTTNGLQNGADAVALYIGNASDFPDGTAVTIDGNLIDAVVYDTNDDDDPELLPLLNSGQPQVNEGGGANGSTNDSIQRIPNGTGGARNTDSFIAQTPTPGTENQTVTVTPTPIYEIQGASHTSALVGQEVSTTGIVTAVASNGFYLQDPNGDGNNSTSDAIFVFTSSAPSVNIGDELKVEGTVSEFIPGGAATGNLSITQIVSPTIVTLSADNNLPTAVVITPPTEIIDNDNFSVFDPTEDGIDFYESLEGMLVQVNDAVAVAPTNRFGEIWVVGDNGANVTGLHSRGGITISDGDFNPERIQIDDTLLPGNSPTVNMGDRLGDVTGVISYSFGNFELLPTVSPTVTSGNLTTETTNLSSTDTQLTIASYNVLNLDPNDSDGSADITDGQFAQIANQIVNNLQSPDIIALQEVQDNNGSVNDGTVDADLTFQTLIDAIAAAGGPTYSFVQENPVNNQDGGQPGGNIRVGYLYNSQRVDLIADSVTRIGEGNPAFDDSRKSLFAKFLFNGQEVNVIDNHFASKGGSDPLFGAIQPPSNGQLEQRQGQAEAVKAFVDDILATDANANVVVLGDLNEFEFFSPLEILQAGNLTNLTFSLPDNERYSFIFQGNSQQLDHILVSDSLTTGAEFDIVHVNTGQANSASDHDPLLGRFNLPIPQEVLWGTSNRERLIGTRGDNTIHGRGGDDFIVGGRGDDLIFGGGGNDKVVGNYGADTFVLAVGEGTDTIYGFNPKQGDLIGLAGDLSFGQLSIERDRAKTIISWENQTLAVLPGVKPSELTESAFINI
ncbi:MAG: endonuclease/exonuclease/phosphatase family protein [Nostocaceae cyanobacterium]|nr:endonuclease/exonuclease/phosphatase family protein [Nostocaceae cyanobacterium]